MTSDFDPHDRICVGACKQTFTPYSMAADVNTVIDTGSKDENGNPITYVKGEDIVPPPSEYTCLHCRQLAAA